MSQKLIFIDLETTGLDTDICEIIECAISMDNQKISDLFKPKNPIPPEISGITNIDDADVVNQGPFEGSDCKDWLEASIDNDYIAVTHNTDFDLAVLERYGIKFKQSICTHKLAWKLLPDLPNHKLGTLRAYFGIPHGGGVAHRADYDVEILEQVYQKLKSIIIKENNSTLNGIGRENNDEGWINKLIELSDQAKSEYRDIIHFGKYKGQKISNIAKCDFGYIQWLKSNTEDKKLKNYLGSL